MAGTDNALQGLYPLLHGEFEAALLESVRQKARHPREVVERFFPENRAAVVEVRRLRMSLASRSATSRSTISFSFGISCTR